MTVVILGYHSNISWRLGGILGYQQVIFRSSSKISIVALAYHVASLVCISFHFHV